MLNHTNLIGRISSSLAESASGEPTVEFLFSFRAPEMEGNPDGEVSHLNVLCTGELARPARDLTPGQQLFVRGQLGNTMVQDPNSSGIHVYTQLLCEHFEVLEP